MNETEKETDTKVSTKKLSTLCEYQAKILSILRTDDNCMHGLTIVPVKNVVIKQHEKDISISI